MGTAESLSSASAVSMAVIAAFGFAILVRDGLLIAVGFALTAGAFAVDLGLIGGG